MIAARSDSLRTCPTGTSVDSARTLGLDMTALPFPSPYPRDLVALPLQPDGVRFPTESWAEGEPAGADVDRLEAELERAFANPDQESGNHLDNGGLGLSLGLVVAQGGRIVAERYHPDSGPDDGLVSWSMAKSVTQAMVGILLRDGRMDLGSLPISEWADDERADISLAQLLDMRSGLAWVEEYEAESDGALTDVLEMLLGRGSDDVAGFAIDQPLAHKPGDHYYYSSGTSNIVSWAVGETLAGAGSDAATREKLVRQFMNDELFGPLGMTSADPRFDNSGTFVGSSFLYATARDFARFGLLYLRDGVWDGQRILPEGWVDRARTPPSRRARFTQLVRQSLVGVPLLSRFVPSCRIRRAGHCCCAWS